MSDARKPKPVRAWALVNNAGRYSRSVWSAPAIFAAKFDAEERALLSRAGMKPIRVRIVPEDDNNG